MQPYSSSPQPYPPSYPSNLPGTPPLAPFPNPKQVQKKPELSKTALISLLALLVLIMFSGFGLIFYASVTRPAQFRARATATTQAIQTVNAQSGNRSCPGNRRSQRHSDRSSPCPGHGDG